MRRLIGVALLTIVVAGCGGNDAQQIRATLKASDQAWRRSDFARACALMTEAAQREQIKSAPNPDARTCVESWEFTPDENGFQAVTGAIVLPSRITAIEVDGDRGRARRASSPPTSMRKVDGRWLID